MLQAYRPESWKVIGRSLYWSSVSPPRRHGYRPLMEARFATTPLTSTRFSARNGIAIDQVQSTLQLLMTAIRFLYHARRESVRTVVHSTGGPVRLRSERTILRSIESQGILTQSSLPELRRANVEMAGRYLPYTRKHFGHDYRHRGLEPLAKERAARREHCWPEGQPLAPEITV